MITIKFQLSFKFYKNRKVHITFITIRNYIIGINSKFPLFPAYEQKKVIDSQSESILLYRAWPLKVEEDNCALITHRTLLCLSLDANIFIVIFIDNILGVNGPLLYKTSWQNATVVAKACYVVVLCVLYSVAMQLLGHLVGNLIFMEALTI